MIISENERAGVVGTKDTGRHKKLYTLERKAQEALKMVCIQPF